MILKSILLFPAGVLLGFGVYFVSYWLIGSMSLSICIGLIVTVSLVLSGQVIKYKKKGASKYELR